jgi:hypothetical protein
MINGLTALLYYDQLAKAVRSSFQNSGFSLDTFFSKPKLPFLQLKDKMNQMLPIEKFSFKLFYFH